ncbi:MAG: HAD-IA family hydrolase [Lachnospiraceae bacterium]|nr:HAD-IA family hydrolase [Lachnospiraceae bacterium]
MRNDWNELKKRIADASVISFDMFDTLVMRLVGGPKDVFALMEEKLRLPGFAGQRDICQMKAGEKVMKAGRKPHADLEEIYACLSEESGLEADWAAVMAEELAAEKAVLRANAEMKTIFEYALAEGKRVIITSDMYLHETQLRDLLAGCGYTGMAAVYVSADRGAAKFRGDLFDKVAEAEGVAPGQILHIGDNEIDDVEMAAAAGWQSWHYVPFRLPFENDLANTTCFDKGAARYLCAGSDDFWYNLGCYAGGPLYTGIAAWFREVIKAGDYDHIYYLARDGYNLQHLMADVTDLPSDYFYMSRRALLLAGIDELDEESHKILPPFTVGQTVREILAYLKMENEDWQGIEDCGLTSLDDVVKDDEDKKKVHRLYDLNREMFLQHCAKERAMAEAYITKLGLKDSKALLFDCGWNGSSQYFLERLIRLLPDNGTRHFAYIGIMDNKKARTQLKEASFESYLFDYNNRKTIQEKVQYCVALFELFFGAPHESVWYYDENGPVFEKMGNDESHKTRILAGLTDYVRTVTPLLDAYGIILSDDNAYSGIERLVMKPTAKEAVMIGDLPNVDGFAARKNQVNYMAKMSLADYQEAPDRELYWPQGLVRRPDVEDRLKRIIIGKYSLETPADMLEAERDMTPEERFERDKALYGAGTAAYLRDLRENPPEDAYGRWIRENEGKEPMDERVITAKVSEGAPFFSVVVPVYNMADDILRACIDSILGQTYQNFELILSDDHSSWDNVGEVLRSYEDNEHVTVIFREENGHISKATNTGIEAAKGDFIVFSDCDDVLAPNALYEMARVLLENPEIDFIYSDEDKLSEDGKRRHSPFFKPDWSPDAFSGVMYTNHLAAYRRSLVLKAGMLRSEFDGTQDYDFTLRFMELSDNKRVAHIPKVLYYWREREGSIASSPKAKPYALEAMRRMKEEMLERRGIKGKVTYLRDIYQYHLVYEPDPGAKVSIVIAVSDGQSVKRCVESIFKYTDMPAFEIILSAGPLAEADRALVKDLAEEKSLVLTESNTSHIPALLNVGAAKASGNYLLFLSELIEVVDKEWLSLMTGHAGLSHIGAVGAKLLKPDTDIIRHDGLINQRFGPMPVLAGKQDQLVWYFNRNRLEYNYLAVSADALLVATEKYRAVGGFDEAEPGLFYDTDFCLKLYEMGLYQTIRNDVGLYTYRPEKDEKAVISDEAAIALYRERRLLAERHPVCAGCDPFSNPNLSDLTTDFTLRLPEDWRADYPVTVIREPKASCHVPFDYNIDGIIYGPQIIISGWYHTDDGFADNDSAVDVILKCEDLLFSIKAKKTLREDVRDNVDEHAYRVGFTCAVDPAILQMADAFEVNILLTRADGKTQLYRKTDDIFVERRHEAIRTCRRIPDPTADPAFNREAVVGSMDIKENLDGLMRCAGWAYLKKEHEHLYSRISLVFCDAEGQWYETDTRRLIREDVARTKRFFHKHLECCGYTVCAELPATGSVCSELPSTQIVRMGVMLTNYLSGRKGWMEVPL